MNKKALNIKGDQKGSNVGTTGVCHHAHLKVIFRKHMKEKQSLKV